MDLKKDYGVDEKLVNNGTWVPIDDVTKILIARMNNKNFNNEIEQLSKPYKRILKSNSTSNDKKNEISEDILCKAYAKTILLDWENLFDNGKKVKYSYDTCYEMLKKYPEFREIVTNESNNINNFFKQEIEEIKENLN